MLGSVLYERRRINLRPRITQFAPHAHAQAHTYTALIHHNHTAEWDLVKDESALLDDGARISTKSTGDSNAAFYFYHSHRRVRRSTVLFAQRHHTRLLDCMRFVFVPRRWWIFRHSILAYTSCESLYGLAWNDIWWNLSSSLCIGLCPTTHCSSESKVAKTNPSRKYLVRSRQVSIFGRLLAGCKEGTTRRESSCYCLYPWRNVVFRFKEDVLASWVTTTANGIRCCHSFVYTLASRCCRRHGYGYQACIGLDEG